MAHMDKLIVKLAPPIGKVDAYLPLEQMDPKTFEFFCCEIIKKRLESENGKLIDAMTIGISGQSQLGADIFSHRRNSGKEIYSLYEVKRYKEFRVNDYRETIKRFYNNQKKWSFNVHEFYILMSGKASAALISEWKVQEGELLKENIEHSLLDKEKIHEWLRELYCPDILYRFCHEAWVEFFYGERALLNIKNYGLWDYRESSAWRNYKKPHKKIIGDTFSFQNNHILIKAFLPSFNSNTLSCFIDFRNGRYNHVLMTISQSNLLSYAFEGTGSSPEAGVRPWLRSESGDSDYYCDIGNCRLKLTLNETQALCDAFDELWKDYRFRMEKLDRICRTTNFPSSTPIGDNIKLIKLPLWLWRRIRLFCQKNDYVNSSNEWSIFDSTDQYIMVHTRNKNEKMNDGHHVTLYARHDSSRINDQYVVLIWQPPSYYDLDNENESIGPRNYWDALTTYYWLIEEMIPAADSWFCNNIPEKQKNWRNLRFFNKMHDPYNPNDIFSYYQLKNDIFFDETNNKEKLLSLLTELQSFYQSYTLNVCFKACERALICDVFIYLLNKANINYWVYICSSIGASGNSYESVVAVLNEYKEDKLENDKRLSLYDYLFRAMIAIFRDGECNINDVEASKILDKLSPFFNKMIEIRFLRRCQKGL
ncbi:hypothetical protein DYB39_12340 [Providencia rettgeri]|uniref:hypothetical protein n=1 Tax=Providencia rettgeri TaxID=587 RepID=UPI000E3E3B2F|nr:hypothetical protein [Providencia rettgeri]RFT10264.1 hypothetical protein DYB39_12340 [Providencia rettgeri]